jgi:hypothetical protein
MEQPWMSKRTVRGRIFTQSYPLTSRLETTLKLCERKLDCKSLTVATILVSIVFSGFSSSVQKLCIVTCMVYRWASKTKARTRNENIK